MGGLLERTLQSAALTTRTTTREFLFGQNLFARSVANWPRPSRWRKEGREIGRRRSFPELVLKCMRAIAPGESGERFPTNLMKKEINQEHDRFDFDRGKGRRVTDFSD